MIQLIFTAPAQNISLAATPTIINERIAIMLGVATAVLALAVFISCRIFLSLMKFFGWKNPGENRVYRAFNRHHLLYWWLFGVVLLAHVMMAVFHTGLPKAGDPGAWVHWVILILGFFSALAAMSLFVSCRFSPRLFTAGRPKSFFENVTYKLLYRFHNYYWLLLLGLVAAHFTIGFLHAGIWPKVG